MSEAPHEPAREVRLRLLGHPLHATLVHLPIGVLASVLVWDILALTAPGALWWTIGFWSLALGLAAAVPAIATGLADYGVLPSGSTVARTATWHFYANAVAVLFYGASLVVRGGPAPPEGWAVGGAVVLAVLGLGFLAFGGYLGAELVYRHRVGERSVAPEEGSGGPEVGPSSPPERPAGDQP